MDRRTVTTNRGRLRRRLTIGAAVTVPILLGGLVLASIPHTDGAIYACYKNENGQLRVIDPATQRCASSESLLKWNQSGVPGPAGSPGPPGPAGPPGTTGTGSQVLAGHGPSFGIDSDTYLGLFGWRGHARSGWSRLPTGGTLADFHAMLAFLPGGTREEDRFRDSTYTFTVMCKSPAGGAASCNGQGPGPTDTPVSCAIRHSDYQSQPNLVEIVPVCTDTSGPSSFRFAPGEWITVRMTNAGPGSAGGNSGQWTAKYTP